jgi:hypothetical protein
VGTYFLALAAEGTADFTGWADHSFFPAILDSIRSSVQRWAWGKPTVRRDRPNCRTIIASHPLKTVKRHAWLISGVVWQIIIRSQKKRRFANERRILLW